MAKPDRRITLVQLRFSKWRSLSSEEERLETKQKEKTHENQHHHHIHLGGLNMNKAIAIALLVGGIVLIVIGVNATKSFSSDVSRFFTGSPTDKAIWMLIGGIAAASIGLVGTMRSSRS